MCNFFLFNQGILCECVASTKALINASIHLHCAFGRLCKRPWIINASHNVSVWGICKRFCFGYTACAVINCL